MRTPYRKPLAFALMAVVILAPGCARISTDERTNFVLDYQAVASAVDYPDAGLDLQTPTSEEKPISVNDTEQAAAWNLSLEDAIKLALQNNRVMRRLGGSLLQTPELVQTVLDPALQETDPVFGIEAALSAFDTQLEALATFQKNDRAFNNAIVGGGAELLLQDFHDYQASLTKQSAAGTVFSARTATDYDSNNRVGNLFPSSYTTFVEGEVRHPLLQGATVNFNRIAGPASTPGVINGVLVARLNADVSRADFRIGLRDFVSNVENAYWDLYFAYRDLDAAIKARDSALETWRRIHALYVAGRRGGEAEKEAQAREQYYNFQQQVQDALNGRVFDGTRTFNGSTGGSFRGVGGVYTTERRLRLLLGVQINDGRLIRPADEPPIASVEFDWGVVSAEALAMRSELQRQRINVRRTNLERLANRNFLYPRLDVVGRYRFRGFGDDYLNSGGGSGAQFDNAVDDLMGGDFQEWEAGVELELPLGFRQAHAAVRNSELQLARERVVLKELERQVLHDVSNAVADVERAYKSSRISYNRLIAAQQQLEAAQTAYDADQAPLELVLDAQRRLADAESRHYRALVEHVVALKNVHFEKGTLLDYNAIFLSEGPTTAKANQDAAELQSLRAPRPLDYVLTRMSKNREERQQQK